MSGGSDSLTGKTGDISTTQTNQKKKHPSMCCTAQDVYWLDFPDIYLHLDKKNLNHQREAGLSLRPWGGLVKVESSIFQLYSKNIKIITIRPAINYNDINTHQRERNVHQLGCFSGKVEHQWWFSLTAEREKAGSVILGCRGRVCVPIV